MAVGRHFVGGRAEKNGSLGQGRRQKFVLGAYSVYFLSFPSSIFAFLRSFFPPLSFI